MTVAEYNQCVDQYSDNVYRFILKNIHDDEMANDIVQDSFLKLWDKKEDISKDKVRSYLFTTAYHTMIDAIGKARKLFRSMKKLLKISVATTTTLI